MSRRGNCWDNAVAESFFSSLKKERIKKRIYAIGKVHCSTCPNTSKTSTIQNYATAIWVASVQTSSKRRIDSVDQVSTKSW